MLFESIDCKIGKIAKPPVIAIRNKLLVMSPLRPSSFWLAAFGLAAFWPSAASMVGAASLKPIASAAAQESSAGRQASAQQDPVTLPHRIELEVIYDPRSAPRNGGQWAEYLTEAGFDRVVLRRDQVQDRVGVEVREVLGRVTLQVTGALDGDRLQLPNLEIRMGEGKKLNQWLAKLKAEGPDALIPKIAFGLDAEALVQLNDQMATPVTESTIRLKRSQVIEMLQQTSPILIVPTAASAPALQNEPNMPLELKGLSLGTALAAYLRPLGLVAVPSKRGDAVVVQIQPSADPPEYWPVGWPIEDDPLNAAPVDLTPALFQDNDIDFRGQTVREALRLIQLKTNVPILIDDNTLLRRRIDFDRRVAPSVKPGITYRRAISELISEPSPAAAIEFRRDEAGTAFLWIHGG